MRVKSLALCRPRAAPTGEERGGEETGAARALKDICGLASFIRKRGGQTMLIAIPKGWFSKDYRVLDGARQVAEIDMAWWREEGRLTVGGVSYQVYREKLMSGAFLLETGHGSALARAEKPSAFFRRFFIEYGERRLTLEAKSLFRRELVLLDGQSEIGRVTPAGFFTRRATVDLPDELPLPAQVFILWLALILWERESDGSPAAGGAGGI